MKNWFTVCFVLLLISCKKESENLNFISLNEIYPMAVGKTFTYRLDSTVTVNFGASLATRSYLAKDSVESTFLDAQNRKSFRIFRYLRDTLAVQPWKFTATYLTTFTENTVEFVDNNLRYIVLSNPVSENTFWKGNAYINTILPSSYYFLDNWDYQYKNLNQSFTTKKGVIQNTYTVLQQNTQIPATFNPSVYNEKSYSIEVYAKGIGLIYKEFLHYIWQPTPVPAKFQDDSYGIKLNLISYN
ncbi:MAG: hypothetical protein KGZ59_05350 [Chitinophagaceae bacterium]|nr:hypothetical protein [Chitinophagaceae bacterium]MBS4043223.1 hypothetical protein [Chitinophagaceae bacterium]